MPASTAPKAKPNPLTRASSKGHQDPLQVSELIKLEAGGAIQKKAGAPARPANRGGASLPPPPLFLSMLINGQRSEGERRRRGARRDHL